MHCDMRRLLHTASLMALAFPAMTPAAFAQTGTFAAEEIVVTAQRREQSILDVPISISAIGGEDIRASGFQTISDLAVQTPGLQVQENDLFPAYFIRGAGLMVEATDLNEQPVGSYLDDVYLGSPSASRGQLFDVERVEVLRGPQGTLFGRNTSAGVVHYLSRRPGEEVNGYLQAGYGSYDRIELEGAVGGAVTSGLRVRASAKYFGDDGWQKDRFTGVTYADNNVISGRVQIELDLSDTLTFWGKIDYTHLSDNGTRYSFSGLLDPLTGERCSPAEVDSHTCMASNGYIDEDFDWKRPASNVAPQNEMESVGYTGRFDWKLGGATLTSITAYRTLDREWRVDGDASPITFFGGFLDFESFRTADNTQFSQELRLAGGSDVLSYVIGGYYYRDRRTFQSIFPGAGMNTLSKLETDSYAGFGQLDFKVTPDTTLTGGLRYTSEERSIAQLNVLTDLLAENGQTDNKLTGKVGIQHDFSNRVMAYASASTGFKSGTYAQTLRGGLVASVDPETVRAFEAGFKAQLLDGLGRISLAAYHNRYKGFQATGSEIDPDTGFTINKLNNVGILRVTGLEAELALFPVENLSLNLGATLAHSDISSNQTSGEVDPETGDQYAYDGNRAPNTPTVQLQGTVRYDASLGAAGTLSPMITANWQSKTYHSAFGNPYLTRGAYALVNARLMWKSADKGLSGQIYVDNLFDKRVEGSEYLISFIGLRSTVWGSRPRTIGVRLGLDF